MSWLDQIIALQHYVHMLLGVQLVQRLLDINFVHLLLLCFPHDPPKGYSSLVHVCGVKPARANGMRDITLRGGDVGRFLQR